MKPKRQLSEFDEDLVNLRGHAGQKPGKEVARQTPRHVKVIAAGAGLLTLGAASVGIFGPNGSIDRDDPFTSGPQNQEQLDLVANSKVYQAAVGEASKTVTVEPPRETYRPKSGDNLWNLVTHHLVDENGQAIDGDPRPLVDELNAQAGPDGLKTDDVLTLPPDVHYTQVDTHPDHQ